MKLRALAIVLFITFTHVSLARVQQADLPKARIEGTVLKTGTNEPVTGVRVTLTRNNPGAAGGAAGGGIISLATSTAGAPPPLPATTPPPRAGGPVVSPPGPPPLPTIPPVTTDRDGKFVIPDLDPASYRLTVAGSAYVKQEYGQRVFPGQGTVLTLTAGQVMKDIVMRLTLTGNVSGRLRDTNGQPAVGVPIQIMKSTYNGTGQKSFQSAGQTRTNDRGEYRLYWVTPGRYVLAAGSSPGPAGGGPLSIGGPAVSPNDPNEGYTFTFYPGVSDVATAQTIDVTSGNEVTADFLVSKQQNYFIRGRVVDATTNQPPPSVNFTMSYTTISGGGGTFSMNTPYNAMTGVFEIRDVTPGSYTLGVGSGGNQARIPLTVTNNIDGLPVVLNSTVNIPGRVTIDGQLDMAGIERVRVQLRAPNNSTAPILSAGSAQIAADGTFRFDQVAPGEYRVGLVIQAGGQEFYLKDAQFDRNDVLNQPLVVSAASQAASLDLVISSKPAQLEGLVDNDKLQPMAGVQVVLIPDKYRDRIELFKSATTDQTGKFTIRSIPPGDYKVFAWEVLENFAYFDPDLLKQVETLGKPVHIPESAKLQVEVRAIPEKK